MSVNNYDFFISQQPAFQKSVIDFPNIIKDANFLYFFMECVLIMIRINILYNFDIKNDLEKKIKD